MSQPNRRKNTPRSEKPPLASAAAGIDKESVGNAISRFDDSFRRGGKGEQNPREASM